MSNSCSIQSYKKYQTLKQMSGISDSYLSRFVSDYFDKYGVFPELDQIPNSNSLKYLKKKLSIKGDSANINYILQQTGSNTIEEAVQKINNEHRDLETRIIPLENEAIVKITRRPSKYYVNNHNENINPSEVSREKSKAVITNLLMKLQQLYGINIINTNIALINEELKDVITDAKTASAFVYNGNIYVNTDVASIDAPIHELLHIFLGGMRFQNYELYSSIVNSIESLPNYKYLSSKFNDRTRMDINEEIFIEQFARYLSDQSSFITSLDEKIIDQIFYNMTRIIDSSLMGRYSAQSIDSRQLYQSSIEELANLLESSITTPEYLGSLDQAGVNRRLANMKEQMLKNNELIEQCN